MTERNGHTPRGAEAGFTLLEVVFVAFIFSTLIISIWETAGIGQRASTELAGRSQFENRARNTIERLSREFLKARVIALDAAPAAPAMSYQLPVDPDDDGDVTDSNVEIEWGSPEPGGDVLNGQIRLEWRADRTVQESALDVDLNRDGDRSDAFQVGRLVKVDSAGGEIELSAESIATSSPNPGGDVTGDGAADPPFAWDGKKLSIDLYFLNDDIKRGGPELYRLNVDVTPRNPAP